MISFQLFRPKIHFPAQTQLFEAPPERSSLLRELIMSRPSTELRSGHTWHIGNVKEIDKHGLYFALGRTTKQSLELWDDESREFEAIEFESAPYTHAFLDLRLQLCAIAARSNLSTKPQGIARQLQKLLNKIPDEQRYFARFEVVPLLDPQDFIEWLHSTFLVRRFAVQIARPNPFDADEDFQKPLEKVLEESNGKSGNTTIKGDDLDSDVLEKISRSAAASGTDANATAVQQQGGPAVRRRMKGQVVTYQEENVETDRSKRKALDHAREIYSRVRDVGADEGDT